MNRRGFLTSILKAGIGAMILPSAVTYARQWKPTTNGVLVPYVDVITDPKTNLSFMVYYKKMVEDICQSMVLPKEYVEALPTIHFELVYGIAKESAITIRSKVEGKIGRIIED